SVSWSNRFLGSVVESHKELATLLTQVESTRADPSRTLISVQEHIAQMCLPTAHFNEINCYHQWFLFDDLWAATHPDLARSLLFYAGHWDLGFGIEDEV